MATKIFLDINIVIDFFVASREWNADAVALVRMIEENQISGYVSETCINTTHYVVRKSVEADKFRILMDEFVSMLEILPCTNNIIHKAYKKTGIDLEDAVLYEIALENNLDYFLTNDIKDFKKISNRSLPVVNYKQLFQQIK